MSRLGTWNPANDAERLDRMESLASIRQLPYRYALALDSRNMGDLVDLFEPDVRMGDGRTGREALKEWFTKSMKVPRTSIHFVGNHIVDFQDADNATGVVYCRDQLERPATGHWEIGDLQYWDRYCRVDGEWCFVRRRFHRWYMVDALTRPSHGAGVNDGTDPLRARQLPEAFPSWSEFWEPAGG